jgi:hypothetical protein
MVTWLLWPWKAKVILCFEKATSDTKTWYTLVYWVTKVFMKVTYPILKRMHKKTWATKACFTGLIYFCFTGKIVLIRWKRSPFGLNTLHVYIYGLKILFFVFIILFFFIDDTCTVEKDENSTFVHFSI